MKTLTKILIALLAMAMIAVCAEAVVALRESGTNGPDPMPTIHLINIVGFSGTNGPDPIPSRSGIIHFGGSNSPDPIPTINGGHGRNFDIHF